MIDLEYHVVLTTMVFDLSLLVVGVSILALLVVVEESHEVDKVTESVPIFSENEVLDDTIADELSGVVIVLAVDDAVDEDDEGLDVRLLMDDAVVVVYDVKVLEAVLNDELPIFSVLEVALDVVEVGVVNKLLLLVLLLVEDGMRIFDVIVDDVAVLVD